MNNYWIRSVLCSKYFAPKYFPILSNFHSSSEYFGKIELGFPKLIFLIVHLAPLPHINPTVSCTFKTLSKLEIIHIKQRNVMLLRRMLGNWNRFLNSSLPQYLVFTISYNTISAEQKVYIMYTMSEGNILYLKENEMCFHSL